MRDIIRPGEHHLFDINSEYIDEARAATNEHLGRIGTQYCFDVADRAERDHVTGIKMVLVPPDSGTEVSSTAAILAPGTYGNDVWAHKVALGATIADQAMQDGIRDDEGNPVGTLLFSAPSMATTYKVGPIGLSRVYGGDFDPIGQLHAELMQREGYSVISGMFANSLAAVIAAPIIKSAALGMDTPGRLILAEYPLKNSIREQVSGFKKEGKEFKAERVKEGIDVVEQIFATGKASPHFELGVGRRALHSAAILHGLTRSPEERLHNDLVAIAQHGVAATVVCASDTKVSDARETDDITIEVGADDAIFGQGFPYPAWAEIMGTNHSMGDRLGCVRWLVSQALQPLPAPKTGS